MSKSSIDLTKLYKQIYYRALQLKLFFSKQNVQDMMPHICVPACAGIMHLSHFFISGTGEVIMV